VKKVKKSLVATAVVLALGAILVACGEPIVTEVAPPEAAPTVNTIRLAQSDESLIMGPTGFGYGPAVAASHGIAVTDEELLMGPTGFGYGPVRTFENAEAYKVPPLPDEQNKALQMRDQILMGY
jgi:hypothetical protein